VLAALPMTPVPKVSAAQLPAAAGLASTATTASFVAIFNAIAAVTII
jgi:hypothetical protein